MKSGGSSVGIPKYVIDARARLQEGREQLRQMHVAGAPARRIVSGMSDLMDAILLSIVRQIVNDVDSQFVDDEYRAEDNIAVILHGGSGRRDMAPYSDVDFDATLPSNQRRKNPPVGLAAFPGHF